MLYSFSNYILHLGSGRISHIETSQANGMGSKNNSATLRSVEGKFIENMEPGKEFLCMCL